MASLQLFLPGYSTSLPAISHNALVPPCPPSASVSDPSVPVPIGSKGTTAAARHLQLPVGNANLCQSPLRHCHGSLSHITVWCRASGGSRRPFKTVAGVAPNRKWEGGLPSIAMVSRMSSYLE
ncbi:hypothetical protein DPEC_G00138380 [Dallia pectoralis]|uniref:Uncharacterized protein n=1 Tax=Dallia pectoralis TaxID=75939 RepID=A0ACC2GLW2_DALPE|nr:hypothetical protein DPEC_G00138380 [Dallia pectoralis]